MIRRRIGQADWTAKAVMHYARTRIKQIAQGLLAYVAR